MTGLIVGVLIYLVSVWGAYKFFQLAFYHPKGESYEETPHESLLIPVFCPAMNSVFTILLIIGFWKKNWVSAENFLKPKHNKWDSKEHH